MWQQKLTCMRAWPGGFGRRRCSAGRTRPCGRRTCGRAAGSAPAGRKPPAPEAEPPASCLPAPIHAVPRVRCLQSCPCHGRFCHHSNFEPVFDALDPVLFHMTVSSIQFVYKLQSWCRGAAFLVVWLSRSHLMVRMQLKSFQMSAVFVKQCDHSGRCSFEGWRGHAPRSGHA